MKGSYPARSARMAIRSHLHRPRVVPGTRLQRANLMPRIASISSCLACVALLAASGLVTAAAPQPEFVPLRAKNMSKSSRVEKPAPMPRLPVPVMAEMRGEIDADGRLQVICDDVRHRHADGKATATKSEAKR